MYSLLTLAFASFALSFILTPLVRNFALRRGWVDHPGARKIHKAPVPRVGGIAIALAYAGAFGILFLLHLQGANTARAGLPLAIRLLPIALVVFLAGLLDDLVGLKPWQKLAGEIGAAALACWAGVQIHNIGSLSIAGHWWHVPLTVLWLVGCMNAVNLIDGMDGLASGVGLFATVTTLMAALLAGDMRLAYATAPLAGALLGFLRYNFNPASIFLGDCGSLLIGFLLGCYGVLWSQKSATVLGMTAPLMALAVPLLDTGLAVVRRFISGKPIFGADRKHIHHRLLDRGLTPRRAVLLLYGVCGIGAALSLLQSVAGDRYTGAIIVLFCGAAWIGIQHLGYTEFHAAGRAMHPRTIRRLVDSQLTLRRCEDRLAAAGTLDECWKVLSETSRTLGLNEAQLRVNGNFYSEAFHNGAAESWNFRVPLPGTAFAQFSVPFQAQVQPMTIAPFAEVVRRSMAQKIPTLLTKRSQPVLRVRPDAHRSTLARK